MRRTLQLSGVALFTCALAACGNSSSPPAQVAHHLLYVRGTSHADTHVWIADANGKNPRNLTLGFLATLSPDGKTVAVARKGGIYLVSSNGKQERRLVSGPGRPLRWTPDGTAVVVATDTSLSLVDRNGQSRVIAHGPIYGFDFSPDGDQIVYSRAPHKTDAGICGDQFDLYVAKLDGGTPKQITREGLSAFPAWGPSRIAYSRFPGGTFADCSAPGIWTIEPDGSKAQPIVEQAPPELTMLGYYGLQPISWVNDDQLLVGARTEYGAEGAILDTKDGHLRRTRSYVARPSSDGTLFVGGSGPDDQVVTITRVDNGRRVLVVKDACCPDWNR